MRSYLIILFVITPIIIYSQSCSLIPIKIECASYGTRWERIIISNQENYERLTNRGSSTCKNYKLPKIDFDQYLLIGINTSYEGCNAYVQEDLIEDPMEQKSYIVVTINVQGTCKRNNSITFWRLLPKKDYMEYEIKIHKYLNK